MSQENVELVLGLHPARDVDLARVLRDDTSWAALSETLAPALHPNFECARHLFGGESSYDGLDGLRGLLLDWYAPYATYRNGRHEAIDLGDRILVLVRDLGRLRESTEEVEYPGANIWTVRGGKVARIDFYAHRGEALEAVSQE